MEVWKVGKTFLIHRSSSMLWEMIVSKVTCMKIKYIRIKHAKWVVWSFNEKTNNFICEQYSTIAELPQISLPSLLHGNFQGHLVYHEW
ncbi:hypothetical protein LDENG_00274790, partial [Lucifuga dentata]